MHGPTMRAPAAQRCLWQQTGNVGETLVSAFWQGTHVHLERCRHTSVHHFLGSVGQQSSCDLLFAQGIRLGRLVGMRSVGVG
jgi:hypothetical protein